MKCPFCGAADTAVNDTRISDEGDVVRRRRRCLSCQKRFTTFERTELQLPQVVKRNGSRVDFDRAKLRASFELALRKRPVSTESVDQSLRTVEEGLAGNSHREISSQLIGELVMRELRKLDQIAYIRYASVYRNFEDVDAFSRVIKELDN